MTPSYLKRFGFRQPPVFAAISPTRQAAWSLLAGLSVGLAGWYLIWRWITSLNPEALGFSITVATAETLSFIGMLLFYYDIWSERDTPVRPPPNSRTEVGLEGKGPLTVDVLITTYDEATDLVLMSVVAAQSIDLPSDVTAQVWLCDDGNRPEMENLARSSGIGYLGRADNRGYKAGNLQNALFRTKGDFIVICDADTQLLPDFLNNTLGYFRDPTVAWVQTPHWFYDIPAGANWARLLLRCGRTAGRLAPIFRFLTGTRRYSSDPFLTDPSLFFDIIQRRRNRHGASFCCGAGSVHRREAVLQGALQRSSQSYANLGKQPGTFLRRVLGSKPLFTLPPAFGLRTVDLQPFLHHVSEDILTSIALHSDEKSGWISVYHPQAESRMLSACSIAAWSVQRLKYAEGTYDIMLRHNPLFRRGMRWQVKLHYAATFWSYLSALWMPVLLFAPAISLVFGVTPVKAYSGEFFVHLLPMLFATEAALFVACKGFDFHQGRILSVATLPLHWRALLSVLRGNKPRFPVTPKTLSRGGLLVFLWPNLLILALFLVAISVGLLRYVMGYGESYGTLITNLFWLLANATAVGWLIPACFWAPKDVVSARTPVLSQEICP